MSTGPGRQHSDATGHSRPHVGSAAGPGPGTRRSAAVEPGGATGGQSPWRDRGRAPRRATQEPIRSAALPGGPSGGPCGSVSGHGSTGPARTGRVGADKPTRPGPRPTRVRSAALRQAVRGRSGARRGRCGAAGGAERAERSRTAPRGRLRGHGPGPAPCGDPAPGSAWRARREGSAGGDPAQHRSPRPPPAPPGPAPSPPQRPVPRAAPTARPELRRCRLLTFPRLLLRSELCHRRYNGNNYTQLFSTTPSTKKRWHLNFNYSLGVREQHGPQPGQPLSTAPSAPSGDPGIVLPPGRDGRSPAPTRSPAGAAGSGRSPAPTTRTRAAWHQGGSKSQSPEQLQLGAAFSIKAEARYLRLLLKPNVRFNKGDKSVPEAVLRGAARCRLCRWMGPASCWHGHTNTHPSDAVTPLPLALPAEGWHRVGTEPSDPNMGLLAPSSLPRCAPPPHPPPMLTSPHLPPHAGRVPSH